jgi:Carboxypeptidase regulatory-like domain
MRLVFRSGTRWQLLLLLALVCAASCSQGFAQNVGQAVRVVQGLVRDSNDQLQANAVVYLQDQKSLEVRTYITEADGHYRFGQLSSEVDYQLWAEYKGHKSKTKSISSFDSKKQFNFDLKIDTPK